MKNQKRAIRRYHKLRMKKRARRIYYDNPPGVAERFGDHIKHCSCWQCGNPRRYFKGGCKITKQEIKSDYDLKSRDLEDL